MVLVAIINESQGTILSLTNLLMRYWSRNSSMISHYFISIYTRLRTYTTHEIVYKCYGKSIMEVRRNVFPFFFAFRKDMIYRCCRVIRLWQDHAIFKIMEWKRAHVYCGLSNFAPCYQLIECLCRIYRWLSAILKYLQCFRNGESCAKPLVCVSELGHYAVM